MRPLQKGCSLILNQAADYAKTKITADSIIINDLLLTANHIK